MPLFDRKSRTKGKAGEPVADMRFEARCPEGHELFGHRTETFQAVRCPECGEGVFIGPSSRLPVPPAASPVDLIPLSRLGDKPLVRGAAAEFEPDDDDAIALLEKAGGAESQARPTARKTGPGTRGGKIESIPLEDSAKVTGRLPAELKTHDPAAEYQVEQGREIADADFQKLVDKDADRQAAEEAEMQSKLARFSLRGKRRRQSSASETAAEIASESFDEDDDDDATEAAPRVPLFRRIGTRTWVALAVVLVIGLTIRAQIRQAYRDRIPEIVKTARTTGLDSLDAGRFDEAKQILAAGAAAFDYVRDESDEAKQIRQAAKEAAVLADLVGRPMEEIIDTFAAGESGKLDFANLDKGRSLVVEARVTSTPETGDAYDVDYRVAVGPGPTPARPLGKLDLKGLELIENLKPRLGDTVLIGVRLRDLELADGFWQIRLDPKSGVLMTRWNALAALGWPVTERAAAAAAENAQ